VLERRAKINIKQTLIQKFHSKYLKQEHK
jgi:hypothetical protein